MLLKGADVRMYEGTDWIFFTFDIVNIPPNRGYLLATARRVRFGAFHEVLCKSVPDVDQAVLSSSTEEHRARLPCILQCIKTTNKTRFLKYSLVQYHTILRVMDAC